MLEPGRRHEAEFSKAIDSMRHILSALVMNRPGVLQQIAGMAVVLGALAIVILSSPVQEEVAGLPPEPV